MTRTDSKRLLAQIGELIGDLRLSFDVLLYTDEAPEEFEAAEWVEVRMIGVDSAAQVEEMRQVSSALLEQYYGLCAVHRYLSSERDLVLEDYGRPSAVIRSRTISHELWRKINEPIQLGAYVSGPISIDLPPIDPADRAAGVQGFEYLVKLLAGYAMDAIAREGDGDWDMNAEPAQVQRVAQILRNTAAHQAQHALAWIPNVLHITHYPVGGDRPVADPSQEREGYPTGATEPSNYKIPA